MPRPRATDPSELARLAPSGGVLLVWTVLMFDSGGYRPGAWLPAGLVLLGLLVVSMVGGRRGLPVAPRARQALLVLAAFTAWCFVSLLWSDAQGKSWEAANLLLVALLGVWTLALAPWRGRTAGLLLVGFSAAAAAACLVALLSALDASDLSSRFEDFRFSPPLDYPNTTAAFGFMAAIPALLLAVRPDASIPAKALGQGLATFLCSYALLPQSRGSILGGLAALAILAVAVPYRWRLTLHTALLGVAVAAAAGPVGRVYTIGAQTGRASGALADALTAILLAAAGGVVGGAVLALAQERIELGPAAARTARVAGAAACALAVLGIAGLGVAKAGSISDTASDQWRSLKNPGIVFSGEQANATGNRLVSTDPLERYDYWRVAADGLRANPLGGLGAGGFEHRYTVDRRYGKTSRYSHNIVLKVAGDTGLVGIALMGGLLVLVGVGLLRGAQRLTPRERMVCAAAVAMLGYFLAHGLFDWLEAYPVLVGPALGFPLVALVVRGRAEHEARLGTGAVTASRAPGRRRLPAPAIAALAGVGLVLAGGSLLAPWLSLRYRDRASATWRVDPAGAYADLDRAAGLDPLGSEAGTLQGVIGLTRGDLALARTGFEQALSREDAWLGHFGLAVIALNAGDRAQGAAELAQVVRLNSEDPTLADVSKRLLTTKQVDPAAAIRDVLISPFVTTEQVS